MAIYRDPGLAVYRDNPFIEALPKILSRDSAYKTLARHPRIEKDELNLPPELRLHSIQDLKRLFIPLEIHLDIEQRISGMIRFGYVGRNPLTNAYWPQTRGGVDPLGTRSEFDDYEKEYRDNKVESSAFGMLIQGGSGVGKTTTVKRILERIYPQVIDHGNYKGRSLIYRQIVWLFLQTPKGGSVKSLVTNFFDEVDRLAGTAYRKMYGNERRSVFSMLSDVPAVVRAHGIGLIVLDELHNLRAKKSRDLELRSNASKSNRGDDGDVIKFLVQLTNSTAVPILMIGSFESIKLFCAEFRLLRRLMGDRGIITWDRMVFDEVWIYFVETMWAFQGLKNPSPLNDELSAILYHETQGIAALAISVFETAQAVCINQGIETIDRMVLRTAAALMASEAKAVIHALRTGDRSALREIGDVFPVDVEEYIGIDALYSTGGRARLVADIPEMSVQPPEIPADSSNAKSSNARPSVKRARIRPQKAKTLATSASIAPTTESPVIKGALAANADDPLALYNALRSAGFVKDGAEFLPDPIHA
jgi:hypothetical protein